MPNSAEAEFFIGRIAFARGRTPDALTHFDRAVSLDGTRGEFHLYVARASFEMGNLGRTLDEVATAINFDPNLGDAYWVRAMVRLRMGAVKDALSDLNKALKLNPARIEAYAVQGDCYEQLRQLPDAIRAYRTALERDPSRGEWWYRQAMLEADSGHARRGRRPRQARDRDRRQARDHAVLAARRLSPWPARTPRRAAIAPRRSVCSSATCRSPRRTRSIAARSRSKLKGWGVELEEEEQQ